MKPLLKILRKEKPGSKIQRKPKGLTSNDFWEPIRDAKNQNGSPKFLDSTFVGEVELYRSLILNPLSHAQIVNTPKEKLTKLYKR